MTASKYDSYQLQVRRCLCVRSIAKPYGFAARDWVEGPFHSSGYEAGEGLRDCHSTSNRNAESLRYGMEFQELCTTVVAVRLRLRLRLRLPRACFQTTERESGGCTQRYALGT
jgi:hypothetical protein